MCKIEQIDPNMLLEYDYTSSNEIKEREKESCDILICIKDTIEKDTIVINNLLE